jgi:hypothetical protein
MTTAKWTINTGEQEDFCYPAARFNEKGCLPVWGGDALSGVNLSWTHKYAHDTMLFQTGQERNMTTFDGPVWTVVFNSSSLHIVDYFMFVGEGEK